MRSPKALLLLFGFRSSAHKNHATKDTRYPFTATSAATMASSSSSSEDSHAPPTAGKSDDFTAKAEQKWSRAANSYVRYFEPMTVVAGRFLLGLIKLKFQDPGGLRVLEAGCGAGGLAKELLLDASSPSSSLSISELVLTDLSEGMLDRARDTLKGFVTAESNGDDNNDSAIQQVRLEQADFTAFDRQKFPDGHFDRYYTNLCLHYAENPDDVVKEASRVLRDGIGIAGFTVWGRRADSPVMTIVPDILEGFEKTKNQKPPEKKRSSFHLGEDDEGLRQRFLRDGLFSRCTVLHYPAVLESLDAKDYAEAILDGAPSTKKELEEDYSEEDQQTIRKMVHDKALEILNKGEPLVLDMAMVVAQK
mmetsp:Transcript_69144/g.140590  ORF Transcript_69144/g.140590 Transcript_69144/m.140590 type:complete len:363 (-) Transcript_69144:1524-2612(-)